MLPEKISPLLLSLLKSKTPPNNTGKNYKLGAKVAEQDLGNKY